MHKHIVATFTSNEPVTFLIAEPFDGACKCLTHFSKDLLLLRNFPCRTPCEKEKNRSDVKSGRSAFVFRYRTCCIQHTILYHNPRKAQGQSDNCAFTLRTFSWQSQEKPRNGDEQVPFQRRPQSRRVHETVSLGAPQKPRSTPHRLHSTPIPMLEPILHRHGCSFRHKACCGISSQPALDTWRFGSIIRAISTEFGRSLSCFDVPTSRKRVLCASWAASSASA
jgi:hypothetical protein